MDHAKAGRRAACAKAGRRAACAKAGRRAACAKNRPFWPVGDKTGDSSRKPNRKADITRDSSAFGRETGPKTAPQPPQAANNRTFWPRLDKTCDYPRAPRPEEAFPRRIKAQQGDGAAARRRSGPSPPRTLRGRSAMRPDSPKRPLRGAFKSIRALQADASGDDLGTWRHAPGCRTSGATSPKRPGRAARAEEPYPKRNPDR